MEQEQECQITVCKFSHSKKSQEIYITSTLHGYGLMKPIHHRLSMKKPQKMRANISHAQNVILIAGQDNEELKCLRQTVHIELC